MIIFLGALVAKTTSVFNTKFNDAKTAGDKFYLAEDYPKALKEYNRMVEASKQDSEGYYKRGLANYQLSHFDKSIEDETKAIELGSGQELGNSRYVRGLDYLAKEKWQLAEDEFTQSLDVFKEEKLNRITWNEEEDTTGSAYLSRGVSRYYLEKYDVSILDLNEALKLEKTSQSYATRAACHYQKEDYKNARADQKEALKIDATDADDWATLAYYQYYLEEFPDALVSNRQALKINGKSAKLHLNQALFEAVAGNWDVAKSEFKTGLKASPQNEEVLELAEYLDYSSRSAKLSQQKKTDLRRFATSVREQLK